MTIQDQSERVEWQHETVPVSTRFGDPYFNLTDGLAETRHVFLAGNDLPARFRDGFHIAELGFGTGLNLVAAWAAWEGAKTGGQLHYTSFEAYPMPPGDMARALAAFPAVAAWTAGLLSAWGAGRRCFSLGPVCVEIVEGDARQTLPPWHGRADAWFLDGFSPAKNPELWGDDVLVGVARHTAAMGTFATYSAAGHVRRGLQTAGFQVERVQGFGQKRHMTRGKLGGR